jgi:exopolysaccharide production protein ExoZ
VGGVVAAAIALTLLVVQTSIGDAPVPWLELLASPMNIEFLLGVAVYTLFRSGGARSSLIGLGALAVLVGFWMSADFSHVRNWARVSSWGLLSFGVFLIAIQFEQEISKFFHLLSKYLGDPSYSLYIFHGLAFSAVDLLLRRLPIQFDSISMMVLLCSGAILVGNVMYRFVEKPMTSRMNAWWSTVSRRWLVSEPTRMR